MPTSFGREIQSHFPSGTAPSGYKNTILSTQKYIPYPIFFSFHTYDNKSSWRAESEPESCRPDEALMNMKKDENFSPTLSGLPVISPDDSAGNLFCRANR
jgi:hypothetical protein